MTWLGHRIRKVYGRIQIVCVDGCRIKQNPGYEDIMKVKIGNEIYEANDVPVMVILSEKDKENIANMLPEATKYCAYPEGTDRELIADWMEDEN